jgi:hypothetical protein
LNTSRKIVPRLIVPPVPDIQAQPEVEGNAECASTVKITTGAPGAAPIADRPISFLGAEDPA